MLVGRIPVLVTQASVFAKNQIANMATANEAINVE